MFDWSSKWAVYSPHKTAIKEAHTGREISYAHLNAQADAAAGWLQSLGVGKGDRVVVLAEFCVEYVVLFSAASRCCGPTSSTWPPTPRPAGCARSCPPTAR